MLLPRPHSEAITIFGMLYDCKGFWDRERARVLHDFLCRRKLHGGQKLINDTAKRVICGDWGGYFASTSVQDVEEKIRR